MCDKDNLAMPDDASIGGGIKILSISSKEALISLGQTIKLIDNWFQLFEENNDNRILIHK